MNLPLARPRICAAMTLGTVALAAFGSSAALAEPALAPAAPAGAECTSVFARATERTVVDCPAGGNYVFCFTREVSDESGLISGRLEFLGPPGDSPAHPDDPELAIVYSHGRLVTADGALEIREGGLYAPQSKAFSGVSKVVGSSGTLAGYSGTIMSLGYASGRAILAGNLCRQ